MYDITWHMPSSMLLSRLGKVPVNKVQIAFKSNAKKLSFSVLFMHNYALVHVPHLDIKLWSIPMSISNASYKGPCY